ncbi:hypothetical protein [Shewanella sp. TC10]|uniref:hypothetical protein n=1 Tax=Shewanella sp. TC10 TaxID=1419739 RepID=UPI00129D58C9|nr:hypothetical protein [Shewanella sp. TC10]
MKLPVTSTIVFNIINCAATQLPQLHELSDAGAGKGMMQLTPPRDSELMTQGSDAAVYRYGSFNSGLLTNGGISPAVLTLGLMRLLHQHGYHIEFRSYNFGTQKPNDGCGDWLSHCQHFGGEKANVSELVENQLVPDLQKQARQGHISILAECGVGGTTFATLWLRLLTGLKLSPAGSTKVETKLTRKELLIAELEKEYRSQFWSFEPEKLLTNNRYHDPLQFALYRTFQSWPTCLPRPIVAGGMMMMAPLVASQINKISLPAYIATTRWVMADATISKLIPAILPPGYQVKLHRSSYAKSRHACLRVFEEGLVVEGCGLGGMMVLAEQLIGSQDKILEALENAVDLHIQAHTREQYEAV